MRANVSALAAILLWSLLIGWHGYDHGVKTERAAQLRVAKKQIKMLVDQQEQKEQRLIKQRNDALKLADKIKLNKPRVIHREIEAPQCSGVGSDFVRLFNDAATIKL